MQSCQKLTSQRPLAEKTFCITNLRNFFLTIIPYSFILYCHSSLGIVSYITDRSICINTTRVRREQFLCGFVYPFKIRVNPISSVDFRLPAKNKNFNQYSLAIENFWQRSVQVKNVLITPNTVYSLKNIFLFNFYIFLNVRLYRRS